MLRFKEYRKKLDKNTTLELNFSVELGEILTIVSNRLDEIKHIKDSFREKTKFKGDIYFKDRFINKQKLIFPEDYGFYNHLSLEKNLKKMSKIFNKKLSTEETEKFYSLLRLESSKKYKTLEKNEKIKFHILFSIIINQDILVIDNTDESLTSKDKESICELIKNRKNDANIVIFDTMLNDYNMIAKQVLVISDGLKSYYGPLEELLIIKQLAAVSLSHQDDLDIILSNYEYTVYNDKEIVVRESLLEDVVYQLLKNGIEVLQIRNLGEKIKLYEAEDGE